MGRRKKLGFVNRKMLASRIELDDYIKFEETLQRQLGHRIRIQDVMNNFVRSCISGTIETSGSLFTGGSEHDLPG